MNTIDKTLQRQLPTNVLLLIVSSLCVLFSCIQILFIHMDALFFVGVVSLFCSLESFFAAYNYRWKEVRIMIPVHFLILVVNVVIGLFLILWREEYCSIASNYNECHAVSIVYGFTNLCCGVVFHGLSLVVAYYFYRLFPTADFPIFDSHLFDENDLIKRIEAYDSMKKITDLHLAPSHSLY